MIKPFHLCHVCVLVTTANKCTSFAARKTLNLDSVCMCVNCQLKLQILIYSNIVQVLAVRDCYRFTFVTHTPQPKKNDSKQLISLYELMWNKKLDIFDWHLIE